MNWGSFGIPLMKVCILLAIFAGTVLVQGAPRVKTRNFPWILVNTALRVSRELDIMPWGYNGLMGIQPVSIHMNICAEYALAVNVSRLIQNNLIPIFRESMRGSWGSVHDLKRFCEHESHYA